ncbi:zinc-ribbon domain-containing protein [Ruania zhangjianzhongii]|uniref:zinc-ribbon domain-containing protein n=1 Tax=Ruania zhangjianzhongii TaxID=2603206 RepID=UPI0011CBC1B0|nr:zinc-ribbon domain-containing protein [Ruania zhangjianzhongii]
MIIFGLVVLTFGQIGTGVFYCPQCADDREYVHSHRRRFFSLFFIPIIPLNRVGEVVKCQTCKTKFVPDVLSAPTQGASKQALISGMRAAMAVILAASRTPEPGIPAALRALDWIGAGDVGADGLRSDMRVPQGQAGVPLQQAGAVLGTEGAEAYLTAAVKVGMHTGEFAQQQAEAAAFIGTNLGLSEAHTRGVIGQVLEKGRAGEQRAIPDGGAQLGERPSP